MTELKEGAKEKIEEIKERVKLHQGKVALCSREINVPGEFIGGFVGNNPSHDHHYYETGIINGELEMVRLVHKRIDLPNFALRKSGSGIKDDYGYFPEVSIPIQRKLSGFLTWTNEFRFDVKSLEGIADGSILIALNELPGEEFDIYRNALWFSSLANKGPRLERFGLYIGDEEVEKFLDERRIRGKDELFSVLKDKITTKGKICQHHYNERKELGKNLAIIANEISNAFRKVQDLEDSVMQASYGAIPDYMEVNWGWDDSHREQLDRYAGLRKIILDNIGALNKSLERGKELYLHQDLPLIEGEVIGFPQKISFDSYKTWLENYIGEINQTFKKIDSHLSEEIKKTSR